MNAGGFMPMPVAVVDHQLSGVLELQWPDGATSHLPHALLRANCRCAACEQARRHEVPVKVDASVRLLNLRPLADKALNLTFSDGHGRGIYPWDYLRELGDAQYDAVKTLEGHRSD